MNIEVIKSIATIAPLFVSKYKYVRLIFDEQGKIIGYKFRNGEAEYGDKDFMDVFAENFMTATPTQMLFQINTLYPTE